MMIVEYRIGERWQEKMCHVWIKNIGAQNEFSSADLSSSTYMLLQATDYLYLVS